MTTPQSNPARTPLSAVAGIIAVSLAASALICWLVYFHAPTDIGGNRLHSLPLLNAVLNGLSTIALIVGFNFIRGKKVAEHRFAMFCAFFFSSIFLVSYLLNFALHGETHLPIAHTGALWYTYAIVLF